VGRDVGVDPFGVGFQHRQALLIHLFQLLSGDPMPAQGTDEAIVFQSGFAQYL